MKHLFIVPGERTDVKLQTHTAELDLTYNQSGQLVLAVDAFYQLHNPGDEPIRIQVALRANAEGQADVRTSLPENVRLFATDEPLTWQEEEDRYRAEVQIGADERLSLQIAYQLRLTEPFMPAIYYPAAILNEWSGNPSLRVNLTLPNEVKQDVWLHIAPNDWTFAATSPSSTVEPDVKWLRSGRIPDEPFMLQFIHPTIWQQIQSSQQAAANSVLPSNFVKLGDLYRQLYMAPLDSALDVPVKTALRERFFAQALAAYTEGVEADSLGTPAPQEILPLHIGLATLYRSRIIDKSGAVNHTYIKLAIDEIESALLNLPEGELQANNISGAAQELYQWQTEGYRLLLNDAQERSEWSEALTLIGALSTLPSSFVDSDKLAVEKREATAYQALALMEQGNRDAAIAFAGDEINSDNVQPSKDVRSLFTSWQITVTSSTEKTDFMIIGYPEVMRQAEAQSQVASLIEEWQTLSDDFTINYKEIDERQIEQGAVSPVQMGISFPALISGAELAQRLPRHSDWALLRTLFSQIAPTTKQTRGLLFQQVDLSQSVNLRNVYDQWEGMAVNLEQQAAQFEEQGQTFGTNDPEAALTAQIKALNYRQAAKVWQELTPRSWVLATLQVADGEPAPNEPETLTGKVVSRSWMLGINTSAQLLTLQAETLNSAFVLSMIGFILFGVFLLSGLFWWLL